MAFNIRMGLPEMAALWNDLSTRKQQGKLDKDEEYFFKKIKEMGNLLFQTRMKKSFSRNWSKPSATSVRIPGTTAWPRTKLTI